VAVWGAGEFGDGALSFSSSFAMMEQGDAKAALALSRIGRALGTHFSTCKCKSSNNMRYVFQNLPTDVTKARPDR
jgi:hypothetical protein